MKNHFDRNPNDSSAAERFRETSKRNYEILKDSQKRAAYDQLGHAAFDQQSGFGSAETRSIWELVSVGSQVEDLQIFLSRCLVNLVVEETKIVLFKDLITDMISQLL